MATSLWGRPDRQSEPGDDRGSIGNGPVEQPLDLPSFSDSTIVVIIAVFHALHFALGICNMLSSLLTGVQVMMQNLPLVNDRRVVSE
jgi:hypothetical protein